MAASRARDRPRAVIYRRAVIDNHRGALRLYVTYSLNGSRGVRVELEIDVPRVICMSIVLKPIARRD